MGMGVIFQIAQDLQWPSKEIDSICYTEATTVADPTSLRAKLMPSYT